MPTETAMIRRPVFLVGAERSGTTMLRLMLDQHPQIAFHFEFEFAVDRLGPDGALPDAAEYRRWLATNRVFQHAGWAIDPELDYRQLVDSFLRQKQRAAGGKPIVGATVHRNFQHLRSLWPDARFLHIVRDGRDVARSLVTMGWAGNVWHAAESWVEAEQVWEELRPSIAASDCFEVRYEDLVAQPEASLRRICAFIGVEYDPRMLEYPGTSTYEGPDPRLIGQWRRKLSVRQVRQCEACLGPWLAARGYPPSGHPLLAIGPIRRTWLRADSRLRKASFRIRRYGPRLWLENLLARRLGGTAWRRRVWEDVRAVDATHLR